MYTDLHKVKLLPARRVRATKPITVYPKKYAHGFCFAVLCCGYALTDYPISIRLTSLALWQSNDCPSASKATLMNMDKYFMCIHYERLHNHNKAKHNKPVCMFLGICCRRMSPWWSLQGLLSKRQIFMSCHCKSFDDRVPVYFTYWCPIFKYFAETWLHDRARG